MVLHVVYQNTQFKPHIRYTLDLLLSSYGLPYKLISYRELSMVDPNAAELIVSYGRQKPSMSFNNHVHIYESQLFSENYLKPESMPKRPLDRYNGLPVIYHGDGDLAEWIKRDGNTIETKIDIIASSFFMLTRYEEIIRDAEDKFSRFPATASLAFEEVFLDRPIVNEYIELLWRWIDSFGLRLKRQELWRDKDFAVCLTHDVDSARKYGPLPPLRSMASFALKQRNPRKAYAVMNDYVEARFNNQDPFDSFNHYMLEVEMKYGFRSSFNFMAGGNSEYDSNYSMNDHDLIRLIRTLRKRGCEIGLHASFNSYNRPEMVKSEKDRLEAVLGDKISGGRMHYLRWKTPNTWRVLEKAGWRYDTTLGFADHVGFRCGICFPYRPFDVVENRRLDIWELPLTIMDASLYGYQKLPPEKGTQVIRDMIDVVRDHKGVLVLLWHNSSLDGYEYPGWSQVYEEIMEYLGKQNVFNETAKGTVEWWERNLMSLIH